MKTPRILVSYFWNSDKTIKDLFLYFLFWVVYKYHLFIWSNFNFLHNSQCITLSTQSCLILYAFCANFQNSHIMWLMVSFLSPFNQHLLFCYILSILALIWLFREVLLFFLGGLLLLEDIVIISVYEFFTPAGGLSLEFVWLQVSSWVQNSPKYCGRS